MYFAGTTALWVKEDNHLIICVAERDGTSTVLLLQAALLQIENNVQSIRNKKNRRLQEELRSLSKKNL
jgi:hypothetical protein